MYQECVVYNFIIHVKCRLCTRRMHWVECAQQQPINVDINLERNSTILFRRPSLHLFRNLMCAFKVAEHSLCVCVWNFSLLWATLSIRTTDIPCVFMINLTYNWSIIWKCWCYNCVHTFIRYWIGWSAKVKKRWRECETVSEKRFIAFARLLRDVCVFDFRRASFALFIIELSFSLVVSLLAHSFKFQIYAPKTTVRTTWLSKMENELAIVYYSDVHIHSVWLILTLAKAHSLSFSISRCVIKHTNTFNSRFNIVSVENCTHIASINTNKANKFNSH